MIEIKNLSKSYGDHLVLNDLNQQFEDSSINGIVGLNGSGKSTCFNCIAKVLKTDKGEVLLNNQPIKIADIAYLETSNYFYNNITGNEYLNIFEQTNRQYNLEQLQTLFQLPLDNLINGYSTGMKKKLALLGLLKKEKSVYLFDEPFNGVDIQAAKVFEQIILTLKEKGKTIFISSHILAPMLSICDSVFFLESGKFSKSFTKNEFHLIEDDLLGRFIMEVKEVVSNSI